VRYARPLRTDFECICIHSLIHCLLVLKHVHTWAWLSFCPSVCLSVCNTVSWPDSLSSLIEACPYFSLSVFLFVSVRKTGGLFNRWSCSYCAPYISGSEANSKNCSLIHEQMQENKINRDIHEQKCLFCPRSLFMLLSTCSLCEEVQLSQSLNRPVCSLNM